MKKVLSLLLGILMLSPTLVSAIPVTVPSAPGSGYMLVSTTTGAYIATSTAPLYLNNIVATGTATSTFQKISVTGAISILGEYFENFTTYVRSLFTGGDGITITAGDIDCDVASGSQPGCLASADWTTFNNKESALTFSWPLIRTTNTISWGGLGTTTNLTTGHIPFVSGANTFSSRATTSVTCAGSVSCTTFDVLGASPITITGAGGGSGSSPFGTTSPYGTFEVIYPIVESSDVVFGKSSSTTAPFWWDVSATTTYIGAGGTGDSSIQLGPDMNQWTIGYDATDKTFAIASSTTVGTNNVLTITKPGVLSFSYSSSTYSSFGTASSTNWLGGGLQTCNPTTGKLTFANGQFSCGTDFNTGGSFPFTVNTGYNSTSTVIGFNGLFSTASSTFSGPLHLPQITSSFLSTDSAGNVYGAATSSIKTSQLTNDAGFLTSTFAFPFDAHTGYVSTSTVLGLNGLFSTASSTFSSDLFLPALTQGVLYTGSSGITRTVATTTVSCSGSTSCTSFVTFGASPITISSTGGGELSPFSTSSPYTGQEIIYPDVIASDFILGATSSTTAPFWWDTSATTTVIGTGGAGDSVLQVGPTSNEWSIGYDETNKDFVFSSSTSLGTLNKLSISKAGLLTFDYGSTTALSGTFLCIGSDCRSSWPTGGGSGNGGTWATTTSNVSGQNVNYPIEDDDIVTVGSNSTTTSEFYVDPNLAKMYFSGTSTVAKSIQIGTTVSRDVAFGTVADRNFTTGESNAGAWNLNMGTFLGTGVSLYTNAGAGGGRLLSVVCDNTALDTQCFHVRSDSDITAVNILGAPLAQGLVKIGANNVGGTDASMLSIDASLAGFLGQGIFLKCGPGSTCVNLRNENNAQFLTITPTKSYLGLGTTTPEYMFQVATSAGTQMALSDAGSNIFAFRVDGNSLNIGTTSPLTHATNTPSQISIAAGGFGTTTLRGLNISGLATSTSNVGYNITTGCYAINGSCISGSGVGNSASSTLLSDDNSWSNWNRFGATTTQTAAQFGSTAIGSNVVKVGLLTGLVTSNSESVGGVFNMNTGTTDSLGMALYNNHTGTNRLLSLVCDAATYGGNCFHVRSDGTESALNIIGSSVGKGVGKITHNSTGDADSSMFSIDASAAGYLGQGIFVDCTGGTCDGTNSALQISDAAGVNGNFKVLWNGKVGLASSTPTAARLVVDSEAGDLFSLWVGSTTAPWLRVANDGFGTTTLSGLTIAGSATSTSNVGFNITGGCYAKNGVCISGSGGATSPGGSDTQVQYNNGGSFGGISALTFDDVTLDLAYDGGATGNFSVLTNSTGGELTINSSGQFTMIGTLMQLSGNTGIKIFNTVSGFSAFASTSLLTDDRTFQFPDASGTLCLTTTCGSGSGTVNTGPAGYLAYYNTTGTAVSPTSTAPLYVDALSATSTTATSTFLGDMSIGSITGQNNKLRIQADRVFNSSSSVGGTVNITNTSNTGPGLVVYTNNGGTSAGNLVNMRCDNALMAHDCIRIDNDGLGDALAVIGTAAGSNAISASNTGLDHTMNIAYTGSTANKGAANFTSTNSAGSVFQITGNSTGLGIAKLTHNGTGDANSSLLSLDASASGYLGQGIFLDSSGGSWTGSKILNLRANGTEYLTLNTAGSLGLASSTPFGRLSVNPIAGDVNAFVIGSSTKTIFKIPTTSTSTAAYGLNIETGCFAINGTCISGSATTTRSVALFNGMTNPDTGGNSWIQPYSITAVNDNFGQLVYVASSTAAKTGFYGSIYVPADYNGGLQVRVLWTAPLTTGDAVFDFDYRCIAGNDAASLDQATFQQSVTTTDTAPTAANNRLNITMGLLSSNCAAGDTLEYYLARDGADAADTLASDVLIMGANLEYSN